MNRSLPQLGEYYNVWDESEGINDNDHRLVVPIICYHWLKINTGNTKKMFISGTEKWSGETKQKHKLLTSDCLVKGKFVAGKSEILRFYILFKMYIKKLYAPQKKVYTWRDVDKFNAGLLHIDLLGRTQMQRIKLHGDCQMVGFLFRCSSLS